MTKLDILAAQLLWEAARLRAMRLWLIEPQDLVATANRLEAVAAAMCEREQNVMEAAE